MYDLSGIKGPYICFISPIEKDITMSNELETWPVTIPAKEYSLETEELDKCCKDEPFIKKDPDLLLESSQSKEKHRISTFS